MVVPSPSEDVVVSDSFADAEDGMMIGGGKAAAAFSMTEKTSVSK